MPTYNESFIIYSFADFGQTDDSFINAAYYTTMTLGASATYDTVHVTDNDFVLNSGSPSPIDLDQQLSADLFVDGVQVGTTGDQVSLSYDVADIEYYDAAWNYHTAWLTSVLINGVPVGFALENGLGGPIGGGAIPPGTVVTHNSTNHHETLYDLMTQCFTDGTEIACQNGTRTVETLQAGDLVRTKDHGVQPVRWVSRQTVLGHGPFAPICFKAGTLGNSADLTVSPMHRMLITGPKAEVLFGAPAFLAHAKDLCNDRDILPAPCREITYFHILFDQHELVNTYGCWSESFAPSKAALDGMEQAVKDELLALFPHLEASWQDALPTLSAAEVGILRV